ncbi:MAG TPA: hypothetical protein VKY24_25480 [Reyranella sp.]|nr:hypothetical protein [Reyranella sp.]
MTRLGGGFAVVLAMLIGALSLTSLLALGLQGHAAKQQPGAADFSPTEDAIVDPSGWPRDVQPEPSRTPRPEQGRSRLPAPSSESGVWPAAEAEMDSAMSTECAWPSHVISCA